MSILRIPALLLAALLCTALSAARGLSRPEAAAVTAIDRDTAAADTLLATLVGMNSGTFNAPGVIAVGRVLERELQPLGFTTRWLDMGSVQRAPSLVAEHAGRGGARVLLLGHMDTVFEPASTFQDYTVSGTSATGPGVSDMKGGLVVIVTALRALHASGLLEHARVTVFLTGDEEAAGEPIDISRRDLIAAGRNADAVLSFESDIRTDGVDYASIARRGSTGWELRVQGKRAHSGSIFSAGTGDGAAFELARILSQFHDTLRETDLTYSAGLVLAGTDLQLREDGAATVAGKGNIVPDQALASGDLRAISAAQLQRVQERMRAIVAHGLPGTTAQIRFTDSYPPMAATPGNAALLATLNDVNRDLGVAPVMAVDPLLRGAGDASFVAPYTAVLDGLGLVGSGAHAPGETADLAALPLQSKRAALLIGRLTQEKTR